MWRIQWRFCLVGCFMSHYPGKDGVRYIGSQWKTPHKFFLHKSGWVVYKFDNEEYHQKFLQGVPYFVFGVPMFLNIMPKCFPFDEDGRFVPVWIQIHGLPLDCWSQFVLSKIGSKVGKPLYTDNLTRTRERLEYVRLMVEIPTIGERVHEVPITLPTGVQVDLKTIYEMVPDFCQTCNKLGHRSKNYRGKATPVGQQRNNPQTDPNVQGYRRPRSQSTRGRERTRTRYGNHTRQQWRPMQQRPNVKVSVDQQELAIVIVNIPITVDIIPPNCENEVRQGEDQMPQQQPPQEVEINEEVPRETEQVQPPKVVQQPAILSEGSTSSSSTSSSMASQEDGAASKSIHTVSEASTSSSLPTTISSTSRDTTSSTPTPTIGTRQRVRTTHNGHK
ncbi:uncharacterized protein LOC122008162 [Zingiber officinale]|uniref:uncharacterized protein LOC122008162 n=1 Tax=Zingiber officinale TaxID=94328 RepID=UPI001C4D0F85|nr:uncharacterized protein LOC122008162 [Zingiber officinale]